ncbi:MAG: tetratricopeptide repeat protein [Cyanobacteria bacterium HKST-UBA02]|nr:tetratricopeptide repeat protein [Cyanobacteria bacterium HKST-UBA02]
MMPYCGRAIAVLLAVMIFVPGAEGRTPLDFESWRDELSEGNKYLKTREFEKAEDCFRLAVKDARDQIADPDDQAMCITSLADVIYAQDITAESVPLYKKALKILRKAHGKRGIEVVPAIINLAQVYEFEGDWHKADRLYQLALSVTVEHEGEQSAGAARCHHLLGRVKFEEEAPDLAEQEFFKSLEISMGLNSVKDEGELVDLLDDYTDVVRRSDRDAKILSSRFQKELLKDQVGLLRKKRGVPASNWSKEVTVRLGTTDASEDKPVLRGIEPPAQSGREIEADPDRTAPDKAALEKLNQQRIDFYKRMIAADINSLGKDHPSVARDLTGLASIYLSQRNYDEARPLLARALKIYETSYKGESGPVKETRLLLELISRENTGEGATFTSYLDKLPTIPLAAQNLEVALRLSDLAFMCFSQGKTDTALKIYYWALASVAQSSGEQSLLAAASMADFTRVLRLAGHASEADEMKSNIKAILRRDLLERKSKLLP